MFPMDGHSFRQIWTRFGVWPPYNLRMVTRGLCLRETVRCQSTTGSFQMSHVEASAAAAISLGQCAARRHCGWACMQQQQLWCLRRQGTSRGQLNTVCVSAGTLAQLYIACCRICTYVSFQLSQCQCWCAAAD